MNSKHTSYHPVFILTLLSFALLSTHHARGENSQPDAAALKAQLEEDKKKAAEGAAATQKRSAETLAQHGLSQSREASIATTADQLQALTPGAVAAHASAQTEALLNNQARTADQSTLYAAQDLNGLFLRWDSAWRLVSPRNSSLIFTVDQLEEAPLKIAFDTLSLDATSPAPRAGVYVLSLGSSPAESGVVATATPSTPLQRTIKNVQYATLSTTKPATYWVSYKGDSLIWGHGATPGSTIGGEVTLPEMRVDIKSFSFSNPRGKIALSGIRVVDSSSNAPVALGDAFYTDTTMQNTIRTPSTQLQSPLPKPQKVKEGKVSAGKSPASMIAELPDKQNTTLSFTPSGPRTALTFETADGTPTHRVILDRATNEILFTCEKLDTPPTTPTKNESN